MELSVREWMIIIGALLIVAVLLDGYRRIRNENRHRIKVSVSRQVYRQARNSSPVVDEVETTGPNPELPNGGARVIGKRSRQSLQLDQSVPVLLHSVDMPPPPPDEASAAAQSEPEPEFEPRSESRFEPMTGATGHDEPFDPEPEPVADEVEPLFADEDVEIDEPRFPFEPQSAREPEFEPEPEEQDADLPPEPVAEPWPIADEPVAASPASEIAVENTQARAASIDEPELHRASLHETRVGGEEPEFDPESEAAPESGERRSPWHGFGFRRRDSEPEAAPASERTAQEVLAIYVVARDGECFKGQDLLQLLLACDLRFGKMNIFHRHEKSGGRGAVQFSVANIAEPGTFDLDRMEEVTTPGVCLFLVLPGPEAPYKAFDYMVETAQVLVKHLDGELRDDAHSALTRQTLEHCRQRIRDFERKQLTLHL